MKCEKRCNSGTKTCLALLAVGLAMLFVKEIPSIRRELRIFRM